MIEGFLNNWQVLLPLILGIGALIFPALKPIHDLVIRRFPVSPLPPNPPAPSPNPTAVPSKTVGRVSQDEAIENDTIELLTVVSSAQIVIEHFARLGDERGEALARQVAQALFAEVPVATDGQVVAKAPIASKAKAR